MPRNLKDILDQWGPAMSAQLGGGKVKFIDSTYYGDQKELDPYRDRRVRVIESTLTYDLSPTLPDPTKLSSEVVTFPNTTGIDQTFVFSQSFNVERSFSWSTTETLSIGLEVSVEAEIPLTAKVGAKITTDLSLSSTQAAETSESYTFEVAPNITVRPGMEIDATLVVTHQAYAYNWYAQTRLSGDVAIRFDKEVSFWGDPNEKHKLWFVPIDSVILQCDYKGIDHSGYQQVPGAVLVSTSGTLTGGQGVAAAVMLVEHPLGETAMAAADANLVPVSLVQTGHMMVGADTISQANPKKKRPLALAHAGA